MGQSCYQRPHRDLVSTSANGARKPDRVVMGKYAIVDEKADRMGQGTSSVCWRGHNIETLEEVAIKIYKSKKAGSLDTDEVRLTKFSRQIEVLLSLQEGFKQPEDKRLWNEALSKADPSRLFMKLLDYSKDEHGKPAPYKDGIMYVITELGQYSLKDYLKHYRKERKALSLESIRHMTRVMTLVVAGLHAKGLTHLDLKPENFMVFNGCLKLIDVDGCVKAGSIVNITDGSLSFSPCYCAPEWAAFVIEDSDLPQITISPPLDVWSIGMTVCELVHLDPILKPMYASFLRNSHGSQEASFLFMEWLSSLKQVQLPSSIKQFDQHLLDLIQKLLLCSCEARMTLAEALDHDFLFGASLRRSTISISSQALDAASPSRSSLFSESTAHIQQHRLEDHSDGKIIQGRLWKLNKNGDPQDSKQWLQRDLWIANNGSLCYFSQKESKRLVLEDGHRMAGVTVTPFKDGAREFAFQLHMEPEHEDAGGGDVHVFACETLVDFQKWTKAVGDIPYATVITMHLGSRMASEAKKYKLTVRNRRLKIQRSQTNDFEPVFKAPLWKLKSDGDAMKQGDWFKRDMWLAKNGSFVYYSKREDRDLVYYSSTDVANSSLKKASPDTSIMPFSFEVQLPPADGIEFAPGVFASESEDMRAKWMREFGHAKALHHD